MAQVAASMSDEPADLVSIQLVGAPYWRPPGQPPRPLARKDAALLALLAIDGAQPRERLAAWLWPDVSPHHAATNLRQHLFKLRRACGHRLFDDGPRLRLAAGVGVDIGRGTPLPEGALLAGLEFDDCPAVADWLRGARSQFDRRLMDQSVAEAVTLEQRHELVAAIALIERVLARWPLQEQVWRRLMRLHYLRGDRVAAIAAFERFEHLVLAEQGSRPTEETLALLRTVEQLQPTALVSAPSLAPACLQHPPRFIGRQSELQRLHQAWEAAQAVLVLGEGGIGKSRLLAEWMRDRAGVLQRKVRPGEAASAYASMVLLLRDLLARWSPDPLPDDRAELARLLPVLGPAAHGQGQQVLLWQAVERLLRGAHARGLEAVVVDDLHLADAASLDLLLWLQASPELAGLRFVFAARPAEPGSAFAEDAWAGASSRIECVRLGPLDLQQLRELLGSLPLQPSALASPLAELAAALHRHAGGHPYFTLETLKAALRAGRPTDGLFADWPASANVQAMLERNLRRLSPVARQLACVAAMAGGDWHPDLANPVLECPPTDLERAWAELETAQLMQGRDFAHDLVREAALQLQPTAWRITRHALLAQALATRPATEPARVAEHWWAAGHWLQAAQALRQAAERAVLAGRLAEHEALLERAADAFGRASDREAEFDARADAVAARTMRLGAEAGVTQLRALQPLALQAAQQARLDMLWAEYHLNQGRFGAALPHSEQALSMAPVGSPQQLDARVLHGHALAANGRVDDAVALLRAAVDEAAACGWRTQEAHACSGLAHALHSGGHFDQALPAQQRALSLSQTHMGRDAVAHATATLATLALSAGNGRLGLQQALAADAHYGALAALGAHWVWNRIYLARCALSEGRFDLALGRLQALHESAAAVAGSAAVVMCQVTRATALLWLGRADLALEECPALTAQDAGGVPFVQARMVGAQLGALQALGRTTAAALEILDQLAQRSPTLREDSTLVLDWCQHVEPDAASAWLQRLRDQARQRGASALERSLGVRQVQCLLKRHPRRARALALELLPTLDAGLHVNLCPAQAWTLLAAALKGSQSRTCRARALQWLQQVRLPEPAQDWQPAHAVWQAGLLGP